MVNEQCIYKIIYITFNDVQTLLMAAKWILQLIGKLRQADANNIIGVSYSKL